MTEYFDVGQFKKGAGDKVRFIRLGNAKPRDKDSGFTMWFDALPTPDENGRIQVSLLPQRDKARPASNNDGFNDDIGF